jgi:molybdopterin synthase catalytic subunit
MQPPETTYSEQERNELVDRYVEQFKEQPPLWDRERALGTQEWYDEIKRAVETGEPFRRNDYPDHLIL